MITIKSSPRLLTNPEVRRKVGLSRATIYRLSRAGKFPAPVRISARASRWVESEVDEWISDKMQEARQ